MARWEEHLPQVNLQVRMLVVLIFVAASVVVTVGNLHVTEATRMKENVKNLGVQEITVGKVKNTQACLRGQTLRETL